MEFPTFIVNMQRTFLSATICRDDRRTLQLNIDIRHFILYYYLKVKMKIQGLSKKVDHRKVYEVFLDFKKYMKSTNRNRFTYEQFAIFINDNDYGLCAYKWHAIEEELEASSRKTAISVFRVLLSFACANNSSYFLDDKNEKTKIINKLGKNLFEFLD